MATGKFCDLLDFIDWSSVECLNQKPDKELANAIKQVLLNSGHNLIELTDSPNLPTKPWAPEFRHVFFAGQGYREDDGLYLESDTDEQLLIYVPFNQSAHRLGMQGDSKADTSTDSGMK